MASKTSLTPQPVTTSDGSLTYLHPVHGASYRSLNGAATESQWVFLRGSGLAERPGPWRVLELGFGTGLNFHITAEAAGSAGVDLHYVALEPAPLPADSWLVPAPWKTLQWGVPQSFQRITLTVHRARWQEFFPPEALFDALYHDPFGPSVAPDCWSVEAFTWAKAALAPRGVLATYGASSAARRAMAEAGLYVGVLPGAPGKREMTVASREPRTINHARPWKRGRMPS